MAQETITWAAGSTAIKAPSNALVQTGQLSLSSAKNSRGEAGVKEKDGKYIAYKEVLLRNFDKRHEIGREPCNHKDERKHSDNEAQRPLVDRLQAGDQ